MESLKIAESVSWSSLTCKLKSPMKMLFGLSGSCVDAYSQKSSMNIAFVVLFVSE